MPADTETARQGLMKFISKKGGSIPIRPPASRNPANDYVNRTREERRIP